MLTDIKLRDFRCFETFECALEPGATVFAGPNARGKTSLLEAACVLLRLASPRSAALGPLVRHGARGFVVDGHCHGFHLQFYYGRQRKKLALDSVEQRSAAEHLRIARVVWFSNQDIALVAGPAEQRRRFMDFVATQLHPSYRRHLRAYERALRSRNHLLKASQQRWREIEAFDQPLADAGGHLAAARASLAAALAPHAQEAQRAISSNAELLGVSYEPAVPGDLREALAAARDEDARLRQTTAGPHRDDLRLELNGAGSEFASEGQQRTMALALKLAQAALLSSDSAEPPLLLIDDIFGELDPDRRNALMRHLPSASQQLITTTSLDWMEPALLPRVIQLSRPS